MGEGKILVMDDEKLVRDITNKLLNIMGYEVVTAIGGEDAIELYSKAMESDYPFSAVIMDLTVPEGMGGKEAVQKLAEIDPKIKAIVSSGHFDDPIMSEFREHGFVDAIAKPYKVEQLLETLQRALTRSHPDGSDLK